MSVKLFRSLLYKSTQIDRQIEQEQKLRWPDRFRLLRLKKLRLAIKDRLHRMAMKGTSENLRPARIRHNNFSNV